MIALAIYALCVLETSPSGLWCHSCGLHRVTTAMQLCPSCADDQRRASS